MNETKSAEAVAAASTRDAARALVEIGLSRRDAAELLGPLHQRVDQSCALYDPALTHVDVLRSLRMNAHRLALKVSTTLK